MSSRGELLLQRTTTENFFTIDVTQLSTGIYPIAIIGENTNEPMYGMLVVNR